MNSYNLSRNWFNWAFDNPELISPNHAAIYFFAIEHNNRLGDRIKFGFGSQMAMDAVGIKKHSTYIKYFNDLVDWGFFKLIQKSKNQYSANIISLTSAIPKKGEALDKAIMNHRDKHMAKQSESMGQSKRSVNKQLNNLTTKQLTTKQGINIPPPLNELIDYFFEKLQSMDSAKIESQSFINHYESVGWEVGNNKKMKNWQASVRGWISRMKKFSNTKYNKDENRINSIRNVALRIVGED